MDKFLVYRHIDPTTGVVFYIGIASRPDRAKYFSNRSRRWKNYVAKHGLPIVEILESGLDLATAADKEKILIAAHGRKGYDPGGTLVNQSLGGEINIGWNQSQDTKDRIGKAISSQYKTGQRKCRSMFGDDNPSRRPDVREKISAAKIGHKHSAETKRKLSENSSARRPDVAAKISAALTGRTGELHARSKRVASYDKSGQLVGVYAGISEAAREIGGDFRLISAVCHGKRKYHKGLNWRFYGH